MVFMQMIAVGFGVGYEMLVNVCGTLQKVKILCSVMVTVVQPECLIQIRGFIPQARCLVSADGSNCQRLN